MEVRDVGTRLTKASVWDTILLITQVVIPTLAKGVLVRRPKMVALSERLGLDSRAVRRFQHLHHRYGRGPLLLAVPLRPQAVLLSPDHVHRVLAGAPEPFAPGTLEKHAALAKFEPRVSLVSHTPERMARRRLNDAALESDRPCHSLGGTFRTVIDGQVERLLASDDLLTWDRFIAAWYAGVREVVLGPRARDDHELTDMLTRLRGAGNWAFFHPGRKRLLRRFREHLAPYLTRPEAGSLAACITERPGSEAAPVDQVTHWLFAFDPAGMATFRTLALLAAHPDAMRRARDEISAVGTDGPPNLPFVTACMMESLRLWPTTPAVLRATTQEVDWGGATMPAHTQILIYAPYFHRDDERLPYAHRFEPDLWAGDERATSWPLIPFSEGPGVCPAHHLVPMLAGAMIGSLLRGRQIQLTDAERLRPDKPLPGTLDNYTLSFRVSTG